MAVMVWMISDVSQGLDKGTELHVRRHQPMNSLVCGHPANETLMGLRLRGQANTAAVAFGKAVRFPEEVYCTERFLATFIENNALHIINALLKDVVHDINI